MTQQQHTDLAATFEQLIFQVRGIQAARVITDTSGAINEVHVVGLPDRTPKQMVRDIESILYVRGGVRLDHRKVSLVQLADTPRRPVTRLQLRKVAQENGPHGPQIAVTLALHERCVEGVSVVEHEAGGDLMCAAAHATVQALHQLIGQAGELQLEQVVRQPLGALQICLSHLSLSIDGGLETLLGVSVVGDDEAISAVRSVLDAVNRRLQWLLSLDA